MGAILIVQPAVDLILVLLIVCVAQVEQVGNHFVLLAPGQSSQLFLDFLNAHLSRA